MECPTCICKITILSQWTGGNFVPFPIYDSTCPFCSTAAQNRLLLCSKLLFECNFTLIASRHKPIKTEVTLMRKNDFTTGSLPFCKMFAYTLAVSVCLPACLPALVYHSAMPELFAKAIFVHIIPPLHIAIYTELGQYGANGSGPLD